MQTVGRKKKRAVGVFARDEKVGVGRKRKEADTQTGSWEESDGCVWQQQQQQKVLF